MGFNLGRFEYRPFLRYLQSNGKKELVGMEIGVYDGGNALNMLESLPIKKLYLIDPYKAYDEWEGVNEKQQRELNKVKENVRKLLKKYKDKVVFIYDFSDKVHNQIKNGELDFLYIDGNHQYEFVIKDIGLYYPKIKKGGIIGGHDYNFSPETEEKNYGVVKAVQEFFKGKKVYFDNIDWWVKK